MAVVDDLVDDLVDEHEILADGLLVDNSTVVPEDLHHAVDDLHDIGGRHVELGRGHEVDAKLLRVKVVQALDVLERQSVER